ncbi:hypothetical protein J6590_015480 [Homalodisca vitripennis]|nr:hypothetical protein J6590_015480 [Homalodisca vitripennis]
MNGENKRRASPVSEGTLIDQVREVCRTNFVDFCHENDDDDDSIQESLSSSSDEIVDDTDDDPTYDPNPDPGKRFKFVVRPRPSFQAASSTPLDCPGPSSRIPDMIEDDVVEQNVDDPDEGLVVENIPRLENIAGGGGDASRPATPSFGLKRLEEGKEKICSVCSGKNNPEGKRKRSRTVCVKCTRGCHLDCLPRHECK